MLQVINEEVIITPEQFTYWLQGFVENNEKDMPTQKQWHMIKDHLQQVFVKKTLNTTTTVWPPGRTTDPIDKFYPIDPPAHFIC